MTLPDDVMAALDIDTTSSAWERTVDITTTGARTGRPRRIEIWFYRFDGRWFLSSMPARRGWYANLLADPRFVLHVKHGATADLAATAVPVPDPEDRRRILQHFVDDLNQPHDPARIGRNQHLQDWIDGSPLLEIRFDALEADGRQAAGSLP